MTRPARRMHRDWRSSGKRSRSIRGATSSSRSRTSSVRRLTWRAARPWSLRRRHRRLIDSSVADLRNTAGKGFGFPIVAATFLQQFAGRGPWAHVDMLGPALLDEDRGDAFGRGASGYGVRMLVELATRMSAAPSM